MLHACKCDRGNLMTGKTVSLTPSRVLEQGDGIDFQAPSRRGLPLNICRFRGILLPKS